MLRVDAETGQRALRQNARPSSSEPRRMSSPACPQCTLENTHADGGQYVCADCGFQWPIAADTPTEGVVVVRDSNGNALANGDTVVVVKDLKVKGSSIPR